MTQASDEERIKRTQRKIGVVADGFWGPKSIAACQRYLRKLGPNPSPWPEQSRVQDFYGRPGQAGGYTPPMIAVQLPFELLFGQIRVRKVSCHKLVAGSLLRVFERLHGVYPTEEERLEAGVLFYAGIYAPRSMRGGSSPSMHSWGIAIDLNPTANANKSPWPTQATMPIEVMECFALEGWTSAGPFWGRDAMHFQATKMPGAGGK